jgi:hypothetical protein
VSGTFWAKAPSYGIESSFSNAVIARSGSPMRAATRARISIGIGPSYRVFLDRDHGYGALPEPTLRRAIEQLTAATMRTCDLSHALEGCGTQLTVQHPAAVSRRGARAHHRSCSLNRVHRAGGAFVHRLRTFRLQPQLRVFLAQPADILPLPAGQQVLAQALVGLDLPDGLAKDFGVDSEISRDVRDRPLALKRQTHAAVEQLLWVFPWSRHDCGDSPLPRTASWLRDPCETRSGSFLLFRSLGYLALRCSPRQGVAVVAKTSVGFVLSPELVWMKKGSKVEPLVSSPW